MIDALRRTLVAVKDLSEQPETPYILVAGAGGTRYYAVDNWVEKGGLVEFFVEGRPVFVCRTDATWSIVNRATVDLVTEEEVLRSSKNDHDSLEKLHGELHPDEKKAVGGDGGHGVYL